MLRREDAIRLRHMLDAAREGRQFLCGRTRQDLEANRMLSLAFVRLIEIIGEAATKVTSECREALPSIPWASIAAMRNRIVHAYLDVDLDRIWDTGIHDLPPLISELERVLATGDEG